MFLFVSNFAKYIDFASQINITGYFAYIYKSQIRSNGV